MSDSVNVSTAAVSTAAAILSLQLVQEEHLSVSPERNRLLSLITCHSVARISVHLHMTEDVYHGRKSTKSTNQKPTILLQIDSVILAIIPPL